ncbi:HIT domain-containing protein [Rhizobium sp. BK491]|uniref:HIT domain-containing protein n=1 Tax=Rhizobium sp. BK491 TaxID=2587009 RepID=UPI0016136868|nr:HIT domain-containing protein [Rhizobium sp. BK491]MBB3571231.1 diadenosine tetraphosphate (Ap4A) HIT family hydrolase [Rhizobium sp. BK491]
MRPASQFFIAETDGWVVSHRANSALPGYLVVASKRSADDLSDLSDDDLREIGPLLALFQAALKEELRVPRVYIGRYGHSSGLAFHFHIIPIYEWVEKLFWRDARYRLLGQFTEGEEESETDGAELTLFVWREFCERALPPPIQGPTVSEAIDLLRKTIRLRLRAI